MSCAERSRYDHADEPAARVAVATIRVEAIGLASRATADVPDGDAGELGADGGPEVDERLVAFSSDDEAETIGHLPPDLEATRADARTDGGDDGRAWRCEALDGDLEDLRFDAAPPGVDGGDLAGVGRGEQDRHAVGDADRDGVTFARADDSVGFDLQQIGGIAFRIDDRTTVYLLRLIEAGTLEADVSGQRVQIAGRARREGVPESVVREARGVEQQRVRA